MPTTKVTLENGSILNVPEGSTPQQIQQWVGQATGKTPQIAPPADTFSGESGLSGLSALFQRVASDPSNPAAGLIKAIPDVFRGMLGESKSELGKVIPAASDPNDSSFQHLIGAIPGVGHGLSHLGTNITGGNYPAAAGDLLSLFGPELAGGALGKMGNASRDAGFEMFNRGLKFDPVQNSVQDIRGAVNEGIASKLPAPKLTRTAVMDSLSRIGDVSKPGTMLGDLESQLTPYVTGQNGAMPLDASKVMGPYVEKLQSILQSPTAGAPKMAATMINEIRPAIKEMDPGLAGTLFDPDALGPGRPFSPAQQTNLLSRWAKNNTTLNVARGHQASRAINSLISDSAYKDVSGSVMPGETSANLLLRKGLKDAVNDAHPEIADVNSRMHDLITLKTAMNQAAKSGGTAADQIIRSVMGAMEMAGGAGVAALAGHHGTIPLGVGGAGALVLGKLLGSPRTATQMGIGLGKSVPSLLDALKLPAQGAAQVSRVIPKNSGEDQIQQLLDALKGK